MNKDHHSLDYLRRLATKLKKSLGIKHAQALNKVAQDNGYSNWKHCCRALGKKAIEPDHGITQPFFISFQDWLSKHKKRNSPLGDLASDMLRDSDWPQLDSLEGYRSYLRSLGAVREAVTALERAWKAYHLFLKRKLRAKPKKMVLKASISLTADVRKITYVSNATAINYKNRTVEIFKIGDPAWISWEGRKALPVTVTQVDERHYTFRIERPRQKVGNIHYVYLDEVRSSPELACANFVTL